MNTLASVVAITEQLKADLDLMIKWKAMMFDEVVYDEAYYAKVLKEKKTLVAPVIVEIDPHLTKARATVVRGVVAQVKVEREKVAANWSTYRAQVSTFKV